MTSAEIFTYTVQPDDDVASLQERIAQDTRILPDNQELLLEAGLALEPHNNIMQCAIDYSVGLNMKCFKRFCRGFEWWDRVVFVRCWTRGEPKSRWFFCLIVPAAITSRSSVPESCRKTSDSFVSVCSLVKFLGLFSQIQMMRRKQKIPVALSEIIEWFMWTVEMKFVWFTEGSVIVSFRERQQAHASVRLSETHPGSSLAHHPLAQRRLAETSAGTESGHVRHYTTFHVSRHFMCGVLWGPFVFLPLL